MRNTKELIEKTPFILKAKQPDMWVEVLLSAYNREKKNLTNVFSREKGLERFHLLDCMKTPWYMCFKKRAAKRLFHIMHQAHHPEKLNSKEEKTLVKNVKRADKSVFRRGLPDGTEVEIVARAGW
jgi:hypothetical protein